LLAYKFHIRQRFSSGQLCYIYLPRRPASRKDHCGTRVCNCIPLLILICKDESGSSDIRGAKRERRVLARQGRRGGGTTLDKRDWCSLGACWHRAEWYLLRMYASLADAAVVAATTGMLPWAFRFAPDCENAAQRQRSLPNRRYLLRISANLRTTLGEVLTLLRLVSVVLPNQPASALQAA